MSSSREVEEVRRISQVSPEIFRWLPSPGRRRYRYVDSAPLGGSLDEPIAGPRISRANVTAVMVADGGGPFQPHRKRYTTMISALVRGPFTIETLGGELSLPETWYGRVGIDAKGYPYPIDEDIYRESYEEV